MKLSSRLTDIMLSDLLGMNEILMHQYIEFVTDWLIVALGGSKLYCVSNPFPFMDMILLHGKTNFFEHQNTEYTLGNIDQTDDSFCKLSVFFLVFLNLAKGGPSESLMPNFSYLPVFTACMLSDLI